MFVGRYEHGLDDKGRIVLPSGFRDPLEDGGVLGPWEGCLGLWTPKQFDEVATMLKTTFRQGSGDMGAMRVFFSAARPVRPDKQGRFVIPEEHRAHAGLTREVIVAGQYDRIEIWDRDRFAAIERDKAPQLAEVISGLRL